MLVPSMRISCPFGREPDTVQYSCLPVKAFLTAPDPLETFTPGATSTSSSKLRPFSGSSRICVGSTTVPSDADVEERNPVAALRVGCLELGGAGARVFRRDGDTRENGARRVRDGSQDAADGALRSQVHVGRRKQKHAAEHEGEDEARLPVIHHSISSQAAA